jgi:hypothetical protein
MKRVANPGLIRTEYSLDSYWPRYNPNGIALHGPDEFA